MKLFSSIFVFICCMYNWLVSAYQPIVSLFKKQTIKSSRGIYKTITGYLSSSSLSSYLLQANMISAGKEQDSSTGYNGWSFNFFTSKSTPLQSSSRKKYEQLLSKDSTGNDSSSTLSKLIKLQSTIESNNESSNKKTEGFAFTQVAGFMEYDPKTAALNSYKRNARASLKRHTEGNWFNL